MLFVFRVDYNYCSYTNKYEGYKSKLSSMLNHHNLPSLVDTYIYIYIYLVYCVVCQMDENILQILQSVRIFLGGESNQTVLEYVELQWVYAGHQNVYPNIELEIINEEGVTNVLLDYHLAVLLLAGNVP